MAKLDAILWTGFNLKEVVEFTGKSPKFNEWFKTWDEYEKYIEECNSCGCKFQYSIEQDIDVEQLNEAIK